MNKWFLLLGFLCLFSLQGFTQNLDFVIKDNISGNLRIISSDTTTWVQVECSNGKTFKGMMKMLDGNDIDACNAILVGKNKVNLNDITLFKVKNLYVRQFGTGLFIIGGIGVAGAAVVAVGMVAAIFVAGVYGIILDIVYSDYLLIPLGVGAFFCGTGYLLRKAKKYDTNEEWSFFIQPHVKIDKIKSYKQQKNSK